jgi:hypothetical protein
VSDRDLAMFMGAAETTYGLSADDARTVRQFASNTSLAIKEAMRHG